MGYSNFYNLKERLLTEEELDDYWDIEKKFFEDQKNHVLKYAFYYLDGKKSSLDFLIREMSKEKSLSDEDRNFYNSIYDNLKSLYSREAKTLSDDQLIKYSNVMSRNDELPEDVKIRLESFEQEMKERGIGSYST